MEILINGEPKQVREGASIAALIQDLGLVGKRVAVEVNQEIVPRSTFAERTVQAGDRIEIVRAIGGG
jgi:sulfur carrier protein